MIIQIYEIQTPGEAEVMVALGVDHIGSVLVSEGNWKDRAIKSTIETVQSNGRKSSLIPLFASVDTISRAIDYYRPDIVHFCDTFPRRPKRPGPLDLLIERQRVIRERFPGIELMRSVPIGIEGHGDIIPSVELALNFVSLSDWFLTDTLLVGDNTFAEDQQPVDGYVGITGQVCSWTIARDLVEKSPVPVILAGGIGPQNVQSAIERVRPAGVDSCTLTNAVDHRARPIRFKKDPQKVSAMVRRARRLADRTKEIMP